MSDPIKTAVGVLEAVARIDKQAIEWELKKLHGIRAWALANLGVDYEVGDRVVLKRSFGHVKDHGWYGYREALKEGATAVVKKIDFVPAFGRDHPARWIVEVVLDREWYVSDSPKDNPKRYWSGRAEDTPEGMEPPGKYDQEHYPDGRRHIFVFGVGDLRKAPPPEPETCETCGQEVTA